MPRGDAARIRGYAVGLVDDARAAGETGVTVRAGEVRDALELDYRNAVIKTYARSWEPSNCRGRPGWNSSRGAGPVRASTRFSSSVSSEAGYCPGRRRRSRPSSRPLWTDSRRPPFPAGASVCRRPGGSSGLEAGRDSAPTCRSNVTSSTDTGGLADSAGRRSAERETFLAVPGCGPAAVGPPPIPPEARWPGRRGGPSVPSALTCDSGSLLPLARLLRNWVAPLSPRFASMVLPFGEGSGRESSKILPIDSLGCLCARMIPEAGQSRSGI